MSGKRLELRQVLRENDGKGIEQILDALLAALKVPDEAMIEAGVEHGRLFGPNVTITWRAMIEAIEEQGK